ncbi:hypothetical protein IB655_04620 [Francisella noatunensis]|uniref:Uncharacterized protein n=1 Tax=Francisella noatunensis TaxID=657445 RepID=A0A9Q2KQD3_9GAMM|nr:hypothetical protein [Francisella noatunensis]MBK2028906.1 hypothetical protein [Francisella noatunensis]MBK2033311.1 hypothetical protein [Francisella noatunensis]MBK2048057.1 hypothetical protein [Francisella noatunensis]MBK2050313.1 hypothetical protein [Francisella noatunensis]MBK2051619.1 hypothetical protein [Francisella noatunensis]
MLEFLLVVTVVLSIYFYISNTKNIQNVQNVQKYKIHKVIRLTILVMSICVVYFSISHVRHELSLVNDSPFSFFLSKNEIKAAHDAAYFESFRYAVYGVIAIVCLAFTLMKRVKKQ